MLLLLHIAVIGAVNAAKPFEHAWDKVSDFMGAHGSLGHETPTQADLEFVAKTYAQATITVGCASKTPNATTKTIDQASSEIASQIKAINPSITMGMYFRSDFVMEIQECNGYSQEWLAHPEWYLKMDNGSYVKRGEYFCVDYSNPDAAAWFAKVIVNASTWTTPNNTPALDYIYIDGSLSAENPFASGINANRSKFLWEKKAECLGNIQHQMDLAGHHQKIVLNGMDTLATAELMVGSGAASAMFDHWSILQFLNTSSGEFLYDAMDQGFALATSKTTSNISIQIKGWPGPIIHQRDQYPPNMHTPKTPTEFQDIYQQRFNSELALFLLVADSYDFWYYSWFWSFEDWVPNHNTSTVPSIIPQANCPVGKPLGSYQRNAGTWTYKRNFEFAQVFVDLTNRTNSHVQFTSPNLPAECK
eukprot:m.5831 g.5831  ORF g.5831 m.5831 type:complete len:418 (+) comp3417_c0_seq1:89-1342(+)